MDAVKLPQIAPRGGRSLDRRLGDAGELAGLN